MKITVNEEKVRAELGRKIHRSHLEVPGLTGSEVAVLIEKLRGHNSREIGERIGRGVHRVTELLQMTRMALNVRNDSELAYLAYERGWVHIEGFHGEQ